MPEVKVDTTKAVAPKMEPGFTVPDFFAPAFPTRLFDFTPFASIREFTKEMNKLFYGKHGLGETWAPVVDVQRCDGNLVITAELPGLKKDEIKVEVTEGALVIEGERKKEHKEDHEGYHRYERSYGSFYRLIPLPENAKAEEIKADLNEGVLKITVPVPEAKKAVHQVAINATETKAG